MEEDFYMMENFNDAKFQGVEFINQNIGNNHASVGRFIRVFKELYSAQDLYVKALAKVNHNMTNIMKEKSDSFFTIYDEFSKTICLYTNVQKEFCTSLFHIIKKLNEFHEQATNTNGKPFNQKELTCIEEFKTALSTMDRAKLKYETVTANTMGQSSKMVDKVRQSYHDSIKRYNKSRIALQSVMQEGFQTAQEFQISYVDNLRRSIKGFGNAYAKFVFDMKEAVDSLKYFYRNNSTENIVKLWIKTNRTTTAPTSDNSSSGEMLFDVFQEVLLDLEADGSKDTAAGNKDDVLIDFTTDPDNGVTVIATTNNHNKGLKKIFQSRKMSAANISSTVDSLLDFTEGKPSAGTDQKLQSPANGNTAQVRSSVSGGIPSHMKQASTSSRLMKWTNPFSSNSSSTTGQIKKFKSATDLSIVAETPTNQVDAVNWQSKSNLHENVEVDEEGFIIRNDQKKFSGFSHSSVKSGRSSSSNSSFSDDQRINKIKVEIRPKLPSRSSTEQAVPVVPALPPPSRSIMPLPPPPSGNKSNSSVVMAPAPMEPPLPPPPTYKSNHAVVPTSKESPLPPPPTYKSNHAVAPASYPSKILIRQRTSQLQRSSRPVSYETKKNYYLRSASVSDNKIPDLQLQHQQNDSISSSSSSQSSLQHKDQVAGNSVSSTPHYLSTVPVKTSKPLVAGYILQEVITADNLLTSDCQLDCQMIVVIPDSMLTYLNDFFIRQSLPEHLVLNLKFPFPLEFCLIHDKAKDFASASSIDTKNTQYHVTITTNQLANYNDKNSTNSSNPTRLSVPLVNYRAHLYNDTGNDCPYKPLQWINCLDNWCVIDPSNVHLKLKLSGAVVDNNIPMKLTINLISTGSNSIIKVMSSHASSAVPYKLTESAWQLSLTKYDLSVEQNITIVIGQSINSEITTTNRPITIRLDYELTIDNFNFIGPTITTMTTSTPTSHSNHCDLDFNDDHPHDNEYQFELMPMTKRSIFGKDNKQCSQYLHFLAK